MSDDLLKCADERLAHPGSPSVREDTDLIHALAARVRELEAERDANRSRAEANDLRIVELMGDVGDLRAALAATDHLYHDDGSVRTCYEYDDDQKAWEAMAAARAVLKESP